MCHDEVVPYVQWHNRAFEMCERLGIPTLVFHYEDYQENFNVTLTKLSIFWSFHIKTSQKNSNLDMSIAKATTLEIVRKPLRVWPSS